MSLSFKPATTNHIPLLTKLATEIWHKHYPSIISEEQINYMLSTRYSDKALLEAMQKGEHFYLAYQNDLPVAYTAIELIGNFYYLHKFYVDEAKHRTGIGQAFFNYLLSQIGNSNEIKLQVNRQNVKAINFYFKNGFVIEKAEDFNIGNNFYMKDFVMVRKPDSYSNPSSAKL